MKSTTSLFIAILFLLFAGVYISCKSKTTTSSEPATIVEKVLPVPKAREIIHNALMHSSNYFWEVYFKLGDASNTSISQGKRLAELAKLDSMIAPGIERNNTTLNVLKGVANPDSSIVYKEYALKLVQWIKQFYEKKYPAFAQSIRSGDDNKITTAYMDVQKFIELVNADYNSFEQASNSIRDKYNIPKTYHFIKNEQDIPVDIDEKILSDTSSH